MKRLALLQMIFGGLAALVAWGLAAAKAGITEVQTPFLSADGTLIFKTDSRPPNYFFEALLLFLGLAIITCGYFQRKKQREGAIVQIVNGSIISIVSGFLTIRAATLGHGEVSSVYYLAYIPLVLGLVVVVVGIRQLLHAVDLRKKV